MNRLLEAVPVELRSLLKRTARTWRSPGLRREQSELARLRRIPRYTPCETTLLGGRMEIADAASFVFAYGEIFRQGIYEFSCENPAPYVIDGGANVGLSVLYFKRLFPNCRVIAFEPDPVIHGFLERNVAGRGLSDVSLVPAALWSSAGELPFQSEGADGGRVAQGQDAPTSSVACVRLRDYLLEPVDLLKLDIEGAETEVLADCRDALSQVSRLFVEYHSFVGQPQTLAALLLILTEAGFRLHVQPSLVSPRPFVERIVRTGMDHQLNVFAWRE